MRFLFLFTLIFASFSGTSAWAQTEPPGQSLEYRQSYAADIHYDVMVDKALENWPSRFDFMQFRIYYSNTTQYDPMGQTALKELNEMAYTMMREKDPERFETAKFAYYTILNRHLANVEVVMQALSLARQHRHFGNPEFLEWIRDGLINTIVISGDGLTLRGAYDVITLAEETMLFHELGVKPYGSQAVKEGFTYYNMHDIRDPVTGENRAVFVNTTIPMKYLEALKTEQDKYLTLDLKRQ